MRFALIVLVLMALSFGGGFWWEYDRTAGVRGQLNATTAELTNAQNTLSLCRLQDQLLSLLEETGNQNYGDAAGLSTKFFDNVSEDIPRATEPAVKSAMQSILAQRDQVTGELAKGDPAAHDMFVQMSHNLHQVLDSTAFQSAPNTP